MTRLTNALREDIADKIMGQVPTVNYRDKIAELLNEQARTLAPPEIMALHGTPAWAYVATQTVWISGEGRFAICPLPYSNDDTLKYSHPDPVWRQLWEAFNASGLRGQSNKQEEARLEMRRKLLQVMQSTSTVNGLRKVLSPDLHQFVPVDVEVTAKLPVPAVVAELKAMGMQFPDTHGGNE